MVRIIHDQSNAAYHKDPALGSTFLKSWLLSSPAHAEHGKTAIAPYTADEGSAVHLFFQGAPELVIEAGETRRGAGWQEAKKRAASVGGVALPKKAYENAEAVGRSALQHPLLSDFGYHKDYFGKEDPWHEASVFVTHPETGLDLKGRPDLYLPTVLIQDWSGFSEGIVPDRGVLIDLKTAVSASTRFTFPA